MGFWLENGFKSRKLWISLLKLLITLCTARVWKSHGQTHGRGKHPFFPNFLPQGNLYKEPRIIMENVEKWKN